MKEEQVLFPYIRELLERHDEQMCARAQSPFGTVENPIRMMEREHIEAADAIRTIRELTGDYTAPADGCATYAVCMAELAEFEHDLHRHVHLENNVLFPRAVALEQRSWGDDRR
jgi:regulator of cell morphogenesis and NO signaling